MLSVFIGVIGTSLIGMMPILVSISYCLVYRYLGSLTSSHTTKYIEQLLNVTYYGNIRTLERYQFETRNGKKEGKHFDSETIG